MVDLKVAQVSSWAVRCGISSYTEKLSHALAKVGCEVYIARIPRFGRKWPEIYANVVHSIPEDVDIIHVQNEYGLYRGVEAAFFEALKKRVQPKVFTMHAIGMTNLDRLIFDVSDVLITHNEFCSRRLRHKNFIIPHGCAPVEPMKNLEAKKKLMIHPVEAPVVGYCGFIAQNKGMETLIETMRTIKNAGLLVGGGWHVDPGTEYIRELKDYSFKTLPGRCKWLGYVEDEDLAKVYGAMDVVVYPSVYITESGALLMALSHGKATIARRLKPTVEKEKQGALWTFKTVRELRRKIRILLKDEDARKRLEEGARAYAEVNSWSEVAKRHKLLYEKVLSKSKLL